MDTTTYISQSSATTIPRVEERTALRARISQFLSVLIPLALLLGVAMVYQIELERGFFEVSLVVLIGFAIHYWLADRLKLPFFLTLSFIAIGWVVGPGAAWLVTSGLILIALCHLPAAWHFRVLSIIAAGGGLAYMHGRNGGDSPVIAILASMFMFRIILYMYDMRGEKTGGSFWQRLAYFFMLPNVCFPLYPVVDYKTFIQTYYDDTYDAIYEKGLRLMARGLSHLLLYRLVYHALPMIDRMSGPLGALLFMAGTYALYLRVSGLFHLIVGILCMFGFNLPRTNNNYFLASSYADLWRRINIYWKQFMMTIVYYPVMMTFRRANLQGRVVAATLVVFIVTWFLHSYQWFWLLREFPVKGTDLAFWGVLGGALMINAVLELRRSSKGSRTAKQSLRKQLALSGRILLVFTSMSVLWTLWDMGSFLEWKYLLLRTTEGGLREWGMVAVVYVGSALLLIIGYWFFKVRPFWGLIARHLRTRFSLAVSTGALLVMVLGIPTVAKSIDGIGGQVLKKMASAGPNSLDLAEHERGYYEALTRATGTESGNGDIDDLNLMSGSAVRETKDIRGYELVPNASIILKGAEFDVNSLGMHDREYDLRRPVGVVRVAVLGSSHVMGVGVRKEKNFENLIEDELNARARSGDRSYQILNFGVAGYGLLQVLGVSEHLLHRYEPDIVLYVSHPGEEDRLIDRLRSTSRGGHELSSYDYLARLYELEDLGSTLPPSEFARRLRKHRSELTKWAFDRMGRQVRALGARPVFVLMPTVDREFGRGEVERLAKYAREAGGVVLILDGIYGSYDRAQLWVAENDHHPNELGHQIIADRLLEELTGAGLFPALDFTPSR